MHLLDVLSGAVIVGDLIAALFFLRFWRRMRDPLFLSFAWAFFLLGVGQTALALADVPLEERSWLYLFRLAAFVLILVAIFRKNRPRR